MLKLRGNFPVWAVALAGVINLIWVLLVVAAIGTPIFKLAGIITVSWLVAFIPAMVAVGFYILMMIVGFALVAMTAKKMQSRFF